MLTEYIFKKLSKATYKLLEDGRYVGHIQGLVGVWADGQTLEQCRETLREVLEEWILLKLKDGDDIPGLHIKKRQSVSVGSLILHHA